MFKRSAAIIVAAVSIAAALPAAASILGAFDGLSTSAEVTHVSKYIWHGLALNPDPAIQPSISISGKTGFGLNFWGSYDTTNIVGEKDKFTESDYALTYSYKDQNNPVVAKAQYLTFPGRPSGSFLRLAISETYRGPLSPSTTIKYDYGNVHGACVTFGVAHDLSFGLGKKASALKLSAAISAADKNFTGAYYGYSKLTATDVLASLSLPIKVAGNISLTPAISYAYIVDGDLADSVTTNGGDRQNWILSFTGTGAF